MHHIHHTQGFILSSRNTGEANKMLTIYTREMGLVRATCQGIRLHKSKLRFSLQDFSYANIDLVRGRDIWRVTSSKIITSFPYARSDKQSLLLIARISKLLERLCDGEESNVKIFDDFIQSLYFLDNANIMPSSREALELHLILRIMNTLGYIGESGMLSKYLESSFNEDKIQELLKDRQSIIAHINKALNESQL
ncbi:MAG TPA: DNA repair protein RecO [Candidatus Paceibacterota bacterium]|jgi:DNA repair protein RecO (recombination protein O)|nr:DNA repair protein RecO [Candidatus Paceibacterota bacterium]